MNSLIITKLKGFATFQDLGRNQALHLGFSGSGAADEYNYLLANLLLNNEASAPAIEVTLGQLSIKANNDCFLVLTGADCRAFINSKETTNSGEELKIRLNIPFQLNKGDELVLQSPNEMLHTYLAIQHGFQCQHWLNSVSQAINEFNLGFGGPQLEEKKAIHFLPQQFNSDRVKVSKMKNHFHQSAPLTLRYLPSQLWSQLSNTIQQCFLNENYQISPNSNRMGYRLTGTPLQLESVSNLSKPVCYGTIQCPSDGQPIVLMKDRQTIGGYPTLGTVIQTDLFRLSQKRPGEKVNFIPITLSQAQAQLIAFRNKFKFS